MRVLKALRRTWRTLEQVEHFINCYTRSFFFFFFFLKEKKKKSAIITIIFRGNKMVETLREFRRHFAPAGVFQRVPSEICARQLGTSQLSRRHPLLSTHKTRKVFFCSNFVCDWDYPPTIFSRKKKKWSADRVRNRMRSLLLLRWVPRHLFFVNSVSLLAVVGNKTMRSDISTKFGRL